MLSKKFLVLILAVLIACAFSLGAYAASGQGYFGPGTGDSYEIDEDYDEDDDDDDDYYDDEDDDGDEPDAPVIVPSPSPEPEPEPDIIEIKSDLSYWKSKNFKPETKSTEAKKVIQSYRLDGAVTRVLIDKHKSAAYTEVGKREQYDRYVIILNEYPFDYFAAYKAAEMNYDMRKYSTALKYIDKSLEIYPDYIPAIRLRRKIQAGLKRVR